MEIKIAVVVGDNGNYAVTKYRGEDTDWGFASDSVGVYDKATHEVIYQAIERRYIITANVELPPTQEIVAASSVTETPSE